MTKYPSNRHLAGQAAPRQRGIALIVTLVLLVVVTLLGLGAIRGTTIMQRITGNFYDRSVAFQAAEAGLQAAAQKLSNSTAVIARTCGAGGVACTANPFTDSTLSSTNYQSVASGNASGQFTTAANAAVNSSGSVAPPQYVIEYMGLWPDYSSNNGYGQTANSLGYGNHNPSIMVPYYRITSRSGDPAVVGDRAVVTLQAMYKQ